MNAQVLDSLNLEELDAVVAHELSHIRNHDGLSRTLLISSVGMVVFLGYGFVQSILHGAPNTGKRSLLRVVSFVLFFVVLPFIIPWVWVVGILMRQLFAQHEYRADLESTRWTGNYVALASALDKLTSASDESQRDTSGLAYLADIIGQSFDQRPFARLFDVHPPLSNRLDRLLNLRVMAFDRSAADRAWKDATLGHSGVPSATRRNTREAYLVAGILAFCVLLDVLFISIATPRATTETGALQVYVSPRLVPMPGTDLTADFVSQKIHSAGIVLKLTGTAYYGPGKCWRLRYRGHSSIQGEFSLVGMPTQAKLVLTHLSSAHSGARGGGYAPITVMINDEPLVREFDVAEHNDGSHGFEVDVWEVSEYLRDGENTILLSYDDDAETHYWIKRLEVRLTKSGQSGG